MRSQSHPLDPRAARASRFHAVLGAAALALLFTGTAPAPDARAQAAAKSAPAAKTPAKKAAAKPAAPPRTGLETLEKQVREFTLPNGLEFIVVGRHDAPVFSFATVVNAGAANDAIGTTGIAHMMEHMAFKGTEIVGTKNFASEAGLLAEEEQRWQDLIGERRKGSRADSAKLATLEASFKQTQERAREQVVSNGYTTLIEQNGGRSINAFTSNDITAYFYSLPSNRLELWALMEAGRMAYPVFREFYKERDVVYEERRMRYESSPSGRLFLEFVTACFQAHPYGFGGIGFPSDLKTFSRTEGEEFYRRNYVAKNMCVALVGDVKEEEAKRLAETYWSALSDAPPPPPIDTVEPEQKAERRVILEDPAQPFIFIGWHCPAATDPRYPAYQALGSLLGGGDFARLNKRLVKEKKIAVQVQAGTGFPGEKYPNLFYLVIVPAAGQDPLAVEQEVYAALDEAKAAGFTAEELDGFKVRTRAQKIHVAETNSNLALELAQSQIMHGDWREWFRDLERVQAIRVEDLKAAMEKTLVKSNRTVGMIVNEKPETGAGGGR
jgi:predicted Zn-dependent peptidase